MIGGGSGRTARRRCDRRRGTRVVPSGTPLGRFLRPATRHRLAAQALDRRTRQIVGVTMVFGDATAASTGGAVEGAATTGTATGAAAGAGAALATAFSRG